MLNVPGARPLRFEGYGPEGAAVLIDGVGDDPEHMRALLRQRFREHGGWLGAEGAVRYLFDRVGRMRFAAGTDRAPLAQAAYAAGAESVIEASDERIEVLTDPDDLGAVRSALERRGWVPLTAEVTERAALTVPLTPVAARQLRELIQSLSEVDGVRHVYSNAEISDAVLARV